MNSMTNIAGIHHNQVLNTDSTLLVSVCLSKQSRMRSAYDFGRISALSVNLFESAVTIYSAVCREMLIRQILNSDVLYLRF